MGVRVAVWAFHVSSDVHMSGDFAPITGPDTVKVEQGGHPAEDQPGDDGGRAAPCRFHPGRDHQPEGRSIVNLFLNCGWPESPASQGRANYRRGCRRRNHVHLFQRGYCGEPESVVQYVVSVRDYNADLNLSIWPGSSFPVKGHGDRVRPTMPAVAGEASRESGESDFIRYRKRPSLNPTDSQVPESFAFRKRQTGKSKSRELRKFLLTGDG